MTFLAVLSLSVPFISTFLATLAYSKRFRDAVNPSQTSYAEAWYRER